MKVLMVITSHCQLGNTGRKTGFWLEELAAPYYVFKDAGVEITLASPKGGRPPLDPKSDEPKSRTDLTVRFEKDAAAETQLDKTLFACDELAGFLTACSLVKPTKSIFAVEAESVIRKMKDKAFARGVSREDVRRGAEELGVPLPEHISFCIEAMRDVAEALGLEGIVAGV